MVWASLVVAIWFIISPFIVGYSDINAAVWNDIVFGVLAGGAALWASLGKVRGVNWINVLFGVYLFLVPFFFAFSSNAGALWNHLIAGALLAIAAYVATTERGGDLTRSS